jgi:hypothetical protein
MSYGGDALIRSEGVEPSSRAYRARAPPLDEERKVWVAGIEPAASCARSRRSPLLSYTQLMSLPGFEPGFLG